MTPHEEVLADLRAFAKRTFEMSKHIGTLEAVPSRLRPDEVDAFYAIVLELRRLTEVEKMSLQRRLLEVSTPVGWT